MNFFKKRLDGFIFSGRDTFTKVINELRESGKPITYHKHKLNLKLNQIKGEPGFDFYARVDAYSGQVKAARQALYDKYQLEDIKTATPRRAWFSFSFKPSTITAEELIKQISALKIAHTVAKLQGEEVNICFSLEIEQLPDQVLNEYFTELLAKSKVDLKMELKVTTAANAHELFGSYFPLLDTLCKGLTCELSLDIWKDFALTQIKMFEDGNLFGLGVTYLFGTTPFAMMCLQGDLSVTIDERSLEILKLKPTGQRLSIMPAQLMMSDEAYLLRMMDL